MTTKLFNFIRTNSISNPMSDNQLPFKSLSEEISYYLEPLEIADHLPMNVGLRSATQETMISLLGSPMMPLTTKDQPGKASALVKKISQTQRVSQHVVVTGILPAINSLRTLLSKAFEKEKEAGHDLESVLSTDGMLVVRLRNPTSGIPSKKISNHSWGSAIDLKLIGHSSPGNTGHTIPRFIAVLIPFFNEEGWYSGVSFHDTMHFEVAEGTIAKWSENGLLR